MHARHEAIVEYGTNQRILSQRLAWSCGEEAFEPQAFPGDSWRGRSGAEWASDEYLAKVDGG